MNKQRDGHPAHAGLHPKLSLSFHRNWKFPQTVSAMSAMQTVRIRIKNLWRLPMVTLHNIALLTRKQVRGYLY